MRQGIHLRGYAQKQPKQEYKREAFELFGSLLDRVRADVVRVLMNVRIQTQEEIQQAEQQIEEESERRAELAQAQHSDFGLSLSEEPVAVEELTLPESGEGTPKARRAASQACRRKDRPQRSVPVWIGKEVQAVSWKTVTLLVYVTATRLHVHSSRLVRRALPSERPRVRAQYRRWESRFVCHISR